MSPVFRPLPRHGANDGAIEAEVNTVSDGSDPRDRRRLPDPSLYPPPQPTIDRLPLRGGWSDERAEMGSIALLRQVVSR